MALEVADTSTETTAAAATENEVHADSTDVANPVESQSPADETSGGGVDGADASSGIDEELAGFAKLYGVQSHDPKEIVRYLASALDNDFYQRGQQYRQQQNGGNAQTQQTQQQAAQSAFDLSKLLPELSADEWDEPVRNRDKQFREAFKAYQGHHEQQLQAVKEEVAKQWSERVERMESFQIQQEQERVSQQIDGFFDKLGAEWTEFGKGSARDMSQHSQTLKARNAVVERAAIIRDGYAARQMNPPGIDVLMQQAMNSLHGHQQATKARQKLVQEAAGKKTAATAGAGSKRSSPPAGREAAKQIVSEAWRQLRGAAAE